jgi:transcriptional regulator with XRE-family HTH domain
VDVGRRLREVRKRERYTQTELARRCGVARNTVTKIESGTTLPSLDLLGRLAKALSVDPGELVTETEMVGPSKASALSEEAGHVAVRREGSKLFIEVTDPVGTVATEVAEAPASTGHQHAVPVDEALADEAWDEETGRPLEPDELMEAYVANLRRRVHDGCLSEDEAWTILEHRIPGHGYRVRVDPSNGGGHPPSDAVVGS